MSKKKNNTPFGGSGVQYERSDNNNQSYFRVFRVGIGRTYTYLGVNRISFSTP